MKPGSTDTTFGRAAVAAVLAVLLSACAKDVVVSGGGAGGGALPTEQRLSATPTPAEVDAALPAWTLERMRAAPPVGAPAAFTDLILTSERASIPAAGARAAAGFEPSFASDTSTYTRNRPYDLVIRDHNAFWKDQALNIGTPAQQSRVTYYADSGMSLSSRGSSGQVDDRVHAEVGWSGSDPTFRVGLRYAAPPASEGGQRGALTDWMVDSEKANQPAGYFTGWGGTGDFSGGGFRDGALKLFVATDRRNAAHTDWLAAGMWWSGNSFGVFADGGRILDNPRVMFGAVGRAEYIGQANGIFSHSGNNVPFQGRTTLIADFADPYRQGSVSGTIDRIMAGSHAVPGNPAISLGSASLDTAWEAGRPGTFTGDASMTWAGQNYTGEWGGQFYGAAAPTPKSGPIPPSAAGVFGVSGGSDSAFVGAFMAKADR